MLSLRHFLKHLLQKSIVRNSTDGVLQTAKSPHRKRAITPVRDVEVELCHDKFLEIEDGPNKKENSKLWWGHVLKRAEWAHDSYIYLARLKQPFLEALVLFR